MTTDGRPFLYPFMILSNSWLWLLLLLVTIVFLKVINAVLDKKKRQDFAYLKKDSLLTEAEKSFYVVLQNVVGDSYLLFSQVSLLEILSVPDGLNRSDHYSALNKIQSKHIDFLLCEKESTRPLLVIELDDSSHSRPDRIKRDEFLDEAFQGAGLSLLHVRVAYEYDREALKQQIQTHVLSLTSPDNSATLS
jgi:very-short-patch-repair endonuclease